MDDAAFFTAPAPIPVGAHGYLVRFQPVDTSFVDTYRIMYLTQSVSGVPTVATAILAVDEERAPFGGYPVLLYGHGSIGLADSCAPSAAVGSINDEHAQEFDSVSSATSQGYAVVAADYEGLGGPGRHPYLVGISEGRSMLDAGVAARQVPGVYLSPDTAILGFSQGGHAAVGRPDRPGVDARPADHRHRARRAGERSGRVRAVGRVRSGERRRARVGDRRARRRISGGAGGDRGGQPTRRPGAGGTDGRALLRRERDDAARRPARRRPTHRGAVRIA